MGEQTNIAWCDMTFNPWRGCTAVSPACANCYAETMSKRNPDVLGIWGKYGTRVIASESMWKQPVKWNGEAEAEGVRRRVFCASLADVFEGNDTMPESSWNEIEKARCRLFDLIDATPQLDWLLLTKRPENVTRLWRSPSYRWCIECDATASDEDEDEVLFWFDAEASGGDGAWKCIACDHEESYARKNVWIGTTVENQEMADKRIPELLKIPAKVRFLSVEPLLGPVDFRQRCGCCDENGEATRDIGVEGFCVECMTPAGFVTQGIFPDIDWIIVGGESGAKARPMHPNWARSIRDQCNAAGVPFFFKQWGEWWPIGQMPDGVSDGFYDPKYGRVSRPSYDDRPNPKPVETRVLQLNGKQRFEFPAGAMTCFKVGKKMSGRELDGRTWDEMPEVTR